MKKALLLLVPLVLAACGHDENGMEPVTEGPVTEVSSYDPVEVEDAPMKVMTLPKEEFMKRFVGKKWKLCQVFTADKEGHFASFDLLGFFGADMYVENENSIVSEGIGADDKLYTSTTTFSYDEETGTVLFEPYKLPAVIGFDNKVRVALVNEESLVVYEDKKVVTNFGDYYVYVFRNEDETVVHQPAPRDSGEVFPFKTAFSKETFGQDILPCYTWSPFLTFGVYDDGTVAMTSLPALKDTYLAFTADGTLTEYFISQQTKKRSCHRCPYTYDKETGSLHFGESQAPTLFAPYGSTMSVLSACTSASHGMLTLVLDPGGQSRFKKIVCLLLSQSLKTVEGWEQTAIEEPL